jgi:hypothetical protein
MVLVYTRRRGARSVALLRCVCVLRLCSISVYLILLLGISIHMPIISTRMLDISTLKCSKQAVARAPATRVRVVLRLVLRFPKSRHTVCPCGTDTFLFRDSAQWHVFAVPAAAVTSNRIQRPSSVGGNYRFNRRSSVQRRSRRVRVRRRGEDVRFIVPQPTRVPSEPVRPRNELSVQTHPAVQARVSKTRDATEGGATRSLGFARVPRRSQIARLRRPETPHAGRVQVSGIRVRQTSAPPCVVRGVNPVVVRRRRGAGFAVSARMRGGRNDSAVLGFPEHLRENIDPVV